MLKVVNYYRFARWLHVRGVPVVPTLIDYLIRLIFACWCPHTVSAGRGLVLGYGGLGVVIHSEVAIGDDVHIDQGVTIGGNGTRIGVPRIESNVYIGAGAKVLGPIKIGTGSVIGANAVVTKDVAPRSLVLGVPGRVVRTDIDIGTMLIHKRVNQ